MKELQTMYMNLARAASTWATCDRKHVGAVVVSLKGDTVATGYNAAIAGAAHCRDVGHLMEDGHCVRTVHAEARAIALAAKHGWACAGSSIYVTVSPCWQCFKLIVSAGIKRVCFGEFYRDLRIFEAAKESGVELVDLSDI